MIERTTYFSKKITLLNVLSTLLVVILHAKPQERFGLPLDISQPFIYMIWVLTQAAVPLFFFISALLFYRNCSMSDIPRKLCSRFWSLVVPYILWNSLFVGIFWGITHVNYLHSMMNMGAVLNTPKEIIIAIITARYTVLWFVKDLIILSLLSPIIVLLLRNKGVAVLAQVIFITLPIVLPNYVMIGYEHTVNWLPIYFMGAIIGSTFSYEESENRINLASMPWLTKKTKWIVGTCSTILFVSLYISALRGEDYFYLYRLIAPICIWFLTDILLHRYINETFQVKTWMSYCFVIYCAHQFLLNVVEKIFVLATTPTSFTLNFMFIACPIVVIGSIILICHLTHDTKVYKILSGGR